MGYTPAFMGHVDDEQGGRTLTHLETLWDQRGIRVDQLFVSEDDGTIADAAQLHPTDTVDLPRVFVGDETGAQLSLGGTIGEGAMGVVRSAWQVPLAREVAVKSVRFHDTRPTAVRELVREARVAGTLEHPNIVPIHALGTDSAGQPLLVMKRIDGVEWTTYVLEPDHPNRPDPERDVLDYHLDVLLDVCSAVAFAHSRGIVHRDIKPDNVMIGAFGQVYVLDWGLAVATDPALEERMPLASKVNTLSGTPQYMAPEMAEGDGSKIGPRTDVYLLGATLHECITGKRRHDPGHLHDILFQAFKSSPYDYGDDVPRELAEICNRACHPDPEQRFESAEAFRSALVHFRRHRGSLAVAAMASKRLVRLREACAMGADAQVVGQLFAEIRFGFERAITDWPENQAAREQHREAMVLMAGWHLKQGNHGAATQLLRDVSDPPEDLLGMLDAESHRIRRLEKMDHELDPNVGRGARAFMAVILGGLFTAVPLVLGQLVRDGSLVFDTMAYLLLTLGCCVACVVVQLAMGHTLAKTAINRRIVQTFQILAVGMLVLPIGTWRMGISAIETLTLLILLLTLVFAVMTVAIDERLVVIVLINLAAYILASEAQAWVFEILAASVASTALVCAWVWRPLDST